jgi:predicted amidophosphoribosyltransferase
MKTQQTYNPCDDCRHSFSKNGQESGMCKICEFTYFVNQAPKEGKWLTDRFGLERSVCSICKATYEGDGGNFCPNCGAKMKAGV